MSSLSRLTWVFLGLWFLGLASAAGQEKPPKPTWTGKLADGQLITRADLDRILKEHRLWIESGKKNGSKADLSRAILNWADLSGVILIEANLSGANLRRANLSGADLKKADLSGAKLEIADLRKAILMKANLSRASLDMVKLCGADLMAANLSKANLQRANLNEAYLAWAKLSGAILCESNLSKAYLVGANLRGVRFEPKPGSLPGITNLLHLRGVDSLTFEETSSYGLIELREIYKRAGMREEERQVTYALEHNRRVNAWAKNKEKGLIKRGESAVWITSST
jgi:hypothetical protein